MHKSLNVIQSSPFVCECETWMRKACEGEKFYKEKEGKRYCVLHYPGKGKELDFKITLEKKLKHNDFNFSGVWFPDYVDFTSVHFTAAADFNAATFSAAADFSAATFSAAATSDLLPSARMLTSLLPLLARTPTLDIPTLVRMPFS